MSESNQNKTRIMLTVYDRNIPVTILDKDEVYYRKAAKLITDTIGSYALHFQGKKEKEELLYMALIDIALRYERESGHYDHSNYTETLQKLTAEIEAVLQQK